MRIRQSGRNSMKKREKKNQSQINSTEQKRREWKCQQVACSSSSSSSRNAEPPYLFSFSLQFAYHFLIFWLSKGSVIAVLFLIPRESIAQWEERERKNGEKKRERKTKRERKSAKYKAPCLSSYFPWHTYFHLSVS